MRHIFYLPVVVAPKLGDNCGIPRTLKRAQNRFLKASWYELACSLLREKKREKKRLVISDLPDGKKDTRSSLHSLVKIPSLIGRLWEI